MFSRSKPTQSPVAEASKKESPKAAGLDMIERRRFVRPLPQPEVKESNDASDWALWESLSRMPGQP